MVEWYQLHLGHPSFRPGLGRIQPRNSDKITSHGNKEIEKLYFIYLLIKILFWNCGKKVFIPFNCCTLRWYCISPATLGLNHHASKLEKGCKLCCGAADTETCPLPHLWFSGSWHQTMDWTAAKLYFLPVTGKLWSSIHSIYLWLLDRTHCEQEIFWTHSIKIALPDLCPALKGSWWTPAH